jgi:NAD(P)H-flavin reductase
LARHIACSKPDANWQYDVGLVTESFLNQMANEDLTVYDYYLCGPPPMIKAMTAILCERGVDAYQILREEFVASGFPDDGAGSA